MMTSATKTLFILATALVLSACQQTTFPDAKKQVVQADERVLGYFSETGTFSKNAQSNQYLRQLYGKTQTQHWVLQDFYHPSQIPQTSAFTVFDERGLYDWDTLQFTDGPVTFFDKSGLKTSIVHMQKGQVVGVRDYFDTDGHVYKKQTFGQPDQLTAESYFQANGKPLFHFDYLTNTTTFYDANGQAHTDSEAQHTLFNEVISEVLAIEEKLSLRE